MKHEKVAFLFNFFLKKINSYWFYWQSRRFFRGVFIL